jgi:hypothetical protein
VNDDGQVAGQFELGAVAVRHTRPSALVWALAAVEVMAAVAVAWLISRNDPSSVSSPHAHNGADGVPMPGMSAAPDNVHIGWLEYTAGGLAAFGILWWLLLRQASLAMLAAIAVAVFASSPAVRLLATQSHLVAMVALDLLLVLAPLLALSALKRIGSARAPQTSRGIGWTVFTLGAALIYAALLVVAHIPAVHHRGIELGSVPLWITVVAAVIGIGFWFGVLRTNGRVPTNVRRAALLGAQEVAAFIGLLSLFGAWGSAHDSPLGLSAMWDQRLGGILMMATCAGVAIPIARGLTRADRRHATAGITHIVARRTPVCTPPEDVSPATSE